MTRKLILLFLPALLAGGTLRAQDPAEARTDTLRGRITDPESQPIELANVALLAADSTFLQGTCSSSDGTFALPNVKRGSYALQVSCVGYETQTLPSDGRTAVCCTLQPATYALDEATVTARRPQFRLKEGGVLETDVRHSLLARLETAAEVLARLPGVRADADGGLTVFGKGTPLIYIDNRRVQDGGELTRLAAADIDRVELLTNPGPEYDAEVKAVVRIHTLRGENDGWGGNARLGLAQSRRTGQLSQAGLHYQRRGLTLQASAYTNLSQERMGRDARYLITPLHRPGETLDVRDTFDRLVRILATGAQASADYRLNRRHSVGASYQWRRTPSMQMHFDSGYGRWEGDEAREYTPKLSDNFQQSTAHQLNAYYQGDAARWHIDLTADALIGSTRSTQEVLEATEADAGREIDSYSRSRHRLYAARLVVSRPVGPGTVLFGAGGTFVRRRSRFDNPQAVLPGADSRIDERKGAAFARYSLTMGRASASAGLRYEHVRSRYYEQGVFVPEQSRTYDDWLPTASVDFPIGKAQASLTYTVKPRRPSFQSLRSELNYNNRYVYKGGNPLLRPETRHDVQFNILWKWLQASAGYQRRRHAIGFQTRDYEGGDPESIIFSSANYPRMEELNVSLFLSPRIGCWEPTASVFLQQPFFRTECRGERRRLNRPLVYAVWRNNWSLPGGWLLSLDADFQSRGDYGPMRLERMWGVDIAVRRSWLNGRLSASLAGSDLWNSRRGDTWLYGSRLEYKKTMRPDSRCLMLTVSYRFRPAAKAYQGRPAAQDDLQRL